MIVLTLEVSENVSAEDITLRYATDLHDVPVVGVFVTRDGSQAPLRLTPLRDHKRVNKAFSAMKLAEVGLQINGSLSLVGQQIQTALDRAEPDRKTAKQKAQEAILELQGLLAMIENA